MKNLSLALGALGGLVFLVGVIGRFYQGQTITITGNTFQAGTFLILANTFLVAGIFLRQMIHKPGD